MARLVRRRRVSFTIAPLGRWPRVGPTKLRCGSVPGSGNIFVYSAAHQALVTDFPAAEAKVHVLEAQQPRQRFTVGGIGAAFLARLYQARPRPQYLALAREYQAFAHKQTAQQFDVAQVCKVGWGAALLYQITGETVYKEWAIKVADYFVETQFADGHWINNEPLPDGQPEIEIGSEFLVYLDVIIASLQ